MANSLYAKYKEKALSGTVDLTSTTLKLVLIDTTLYTRNLSTHEFLSDIPSGARVATTSALASKTVTAGAFDSADPSFIAVTGAVSGQLAMYKDTGSAATSPLICNYDTATNLPVTPNGGDIAVAVNASGWFAL